MSQTTIRQKSALLTAANRPQDKFLYHYTSLNSAFEHILHEGALKLSPMHLTNDPRESKEWYFSVKKSPSLEDDQATWKDNDKINAYLNMEIKKGCKLTCFSQDDEYTTSNSDCGWAHPRMWAQYADNHRGICLAFDKTLLVSDAEKSLEGKGQLYYEKVTYLNYHDLMKQNVFLLDSQAINKKALTHTVKQLIKEQYRQLFFTKHSDWLQEREFRILLKDKEESPEFIPIHNSIFAVIVGVDFPFAAYLPLLRFYCHKYSIPVATTIWRNGMPTLHCCVFDD